MNKSARFVPFWVMFGVLGILLIGSFITPFKIVLDDIFRNIEINSSSNGTPTLSCKDPSATNIMKATCFSLGGFMFLFVGYLLYNWVSGMLTGAISPTPIISRRRLLTQQLEG